MDTPSHDAAEVIDVTEGDRTTVRLDRGLDPFAGLDQQERVRLIVRVLCGLVAYDNSESADQAAA